MSELPAAHAGLLADCIARAKADLVPASIDQIDQAIFAISAMPSSGGSVVDMKATIALYHIGLGDVPADLLVEGVREAIRESTRWRPMPGLIRQSIEPELAARKLRLARLERAAQ